MPVIAPGVVKLVRTLEVSIRNESGVGNLPYGARTRTENLALVKIVDFEPRTQRFLVLYKVPSSSHVRPKQSLCPNGAFFFITEADLMQAGKLSQEDIDLLRDLCFIRDSVYKFLSLRRMWKEKEEELKTFINQP